MRSETVVMLLRSQKEVSWYVTVFRDALSPKALLVCMQLLCVKGGQNLSVLCGL